MSIYNTYPVDCANLTFFYSINASSATVTSLHQCSRMPNFSGTTTAIKTTCSELITIIKKKKNRIREEKPNNCAHAASSCTGQKFHISCLLNLFRLKLDWMQPYGSALKWQPKRVSGLRGYSGGYAKQSIHKAKILIFSHPFLQEQKNKRERDEATVLTDVAWL